MGAGIKVSAWDRFLISLFPGWGLRRVRSRAAASMYGRHYDAAATSRRTSGWQRHSSDATAAAVSSSAELRMLSRDLKRNNPWARRGIEVIANNVVGWGIKPRIASGKGSDVDPELAARALRVWEDWAGSPRCDYDGRCDFYGLQWLVMSCVVESGEALVLRDRANNADGLPTPLRVRVLEPDYLDTQKDGKEGSEGGPIVAGIEYDGRGRRVAYWLFPVHPGSSYPAGVSVQSRRVPASDVLHVYRVDRLGQSRGVPWLAAAIARLHDLDDYEDARLMQAKVAACFGAIVHEADGFGGTLGTPSTTDDRIETLEPGSIQYLPAGKSVSFAQPPSTSDHGTFTATNLRAVAAALGVTYEDLTGDYSKVNFSSARMARLAHWGNVHVWRWHCLIPQLCDGVWGWVMDQAAALEGWRTTPRALWSPPPAPMLQPEKEGLALTKLVRGGFKTLPEVWSEQGNDPRAHMAEIAQTNKELDELGIVLDSDPRRTASTGQVQASQPPLETDADD